MAEALMEGARQVVNKPGSRMTVELWIGQVSPVRGKITLMYKGYGVSLPDLLPGATRHNLDVLFEKLVAMPVEGASPGQSQVVSLVVPIKNCTLNLSLLLD